MRKRLCGWMVGCCLFAASAMGAPTPGAVPDLDGLLVDQTGLLDADAQQALAQRLRGIQASDRAQLAILVSSGTHGEALADYSLRVAQAWKLGHAGRDDGLLILVLPASRAARIEVGYGLEGAIPDVRAARWIDELLLAMADRPLAASLNQLLDEVEAALPSAPDQAASASAENILDRHPEWKPPFVLAIFSPFALFPLFIGRRGGLVSAPLFACFLGGAAYLLWDSRAAALGVAGIAGVLPLLWGLNQFGPGGTVLPAWLRIARALGNIAAVLVFFSIITVFVGAGLSGNVDEVWAAPLFAGVLAIALAVFLFPGKPAGYLMLLLRSVCHFVFVLLIAYLSLRALLPHPARIAFAVAGAFTAIVALSLYLDGRERARGASGEANGPRWSLWLVGLALLIGVPFGVLLLAQAALGGDFQWRLGQAAAGGGSIGGVLWWAARHGFFAAVASGLGGRFGGGGAEGRD